MGGGLWRVESQCRIVKGEYKRVLRGRKSGWWLEESGGEGWSVAGSGHRFWGHQEEKAQQPARPPTIITGRTTFSSHAGEPCFRVLLQDVAEGRAC